MGYDGDPTGDDTSPQDVSEYANYTAADWAAKGYCLGDWIAMGYTALDLAGES